MTFLLYLCSLRLDWTAIRQRPFQKRMSVDRGLSRPFLLASPVGLAAAAGNAAFPAGWLLVIYCLVILVLRVAFMEPEGHGDRFR